MQKRDHRIVRLAEKFDFYFSPVSNPDGYEYTFKNAKVSDSLEYNDANENIWNVYMYYSFSFYPSSDSLMEQDKK